MDELRRLELLARVIELEGTLRNMLSVALWLRQELAAPAKEPVELKLVPKAE